MNPASPLVLVGNPGSRRSDLFLAAAGRAGVPVSLLPWRRLAAGPVRLPEGAPVRIDSPGGDPEVDRLLRGADQPAEHGEIIGLGAWYAGLVAALDRLAVAARAAGALLLNDPDDIRVMFDKRAAHHRLTAAGVPVPPALPGAIADYGHLRAVLRDAGWARVFVKPAYSSSASGVLALRLARGRVAATTPVELAGDGRLFNSLRIRTYDDERTVGAIIDRLAPEGLHIERWFPKAGLDGRVIDLRVLVVAGEPGHLVVRSSQGPLTNLHLGNARGELGAVRVRLGGPGYDRLLRICAAAAACFPGSLHAGVDLMVGVDWRRLAVAEVNAFGDLLPAVVDTVGQDSYAAQLHALRSGRFAAWRAMRPAPWVAPEELESVA